MKTASDFVGQHVGESQTKTNSILDGAKGKVLIIDEAYALDDNMYGKQVLDTLVEKIQGTPSDDIAVLLLGYEEPMLAMLRNQNPGLARRWGKDYGFYFEDYDDNQLLQILQSNLKRMGITASMKFQRKALDILSSQREQSNFGNAGAVELLLKNAIQKMSQREDSSRLEEADLEDFGSNRATKDGDPLDLLDRLYKMGSVKNKLEKLRDAFIVAKREGESKPDVGHFVFTGSPGTGKTTVARSIAQILYSLELIPTNTIIESSGLDLTGDFVGQTKTKVTKILQEAKGGVLFIDEAYNVGFGPFGKEACDTLVAAMTSEEYKDLVIIIAGYEADIDKMLSGNAGLKSRFTEFFNFPDWEAHDCIQFFEGLAVKENFCLDTGVAESLRFQIPRLINLEGWGNGRDVTRIWRSSLTNRASRIATSSHELERIIKLQDVEEATKELLMARAPKSGNLMGGGSFPELDDLPMMSSENVCNNPTKTKSQVEETLIEEEKEESEVEIEEEIVLETETDHRDDGVPDTVWAELQKAKEEQKMLQEQHEEYLAFLKQKAKEDRLARIAFEKEKERIQKELQEEARREAERILFEAEERRKENIRLEKQKREKEEQMRLEKMRQLQKVRQKLQQLRPCPAGFNWYKCSRGWRCGGGSHYVSDEELKRSFTC